jgi:hypothetical protein
MWQIAVRADGFLEACHGGPLGQPVRAQNLNNGIEVHNSLLTVVLSDQAVDLSGVK